jgi:hypothetical protein
VGKPFAIEFTNSDVDTPHNVAIYTDSSASTRLFVGEIFPGAASRTYSVPALDPHVLLPLRRPPDADDRERGGRLNLDRSGR